MPLRGGLKYEFFKAWGNLSIRWGADFESNAPAHRLDESPVGYSSAGWSPPLPDSASPTRTSILQNAPTVERFSSQSLSDSGRKSAKFFGNISE
jgi:hypothetical protein